MAKRKIPSTAEHPASARQADQLLGDLCQGVCGRYGEAIVATLSQLSRNGRSMPTDPVAAD